MLDIMITSVFGIASVLALASCAVSLRRGWGLAWRLLAELDLVEGNSGSAVDAQYRRARHRSAQYQWLQYRRNIRRRVRRTPRATLYPGGDCVPFACAAV